MSRSAIRPFAMQEYSRRALPSPKNDHRRRQRHDAEDDPADRLRSAESKSC